MWGNRVGPTQKGLWTDPVTGMSYARARWLDTRTATWLSEDPAGAVDSPNLYAFVGWQPNMATDPMGLCLGVDNLPCSDWYLAWQEAQAKTAVTVVKGVAHGTVKTVDFASMGQISGLGARIGTFFGSGGSLTERAEAANAAGREHSLDVVTLGFYSAPDRREHAKGLANNALGLEAQRQGSAMAFEGVAEGDWEKSIRGGAEWLGGASQTVLTIAGIGEGVQTLARPKTPVGSVAPQADIVYRRVTAGDRPQFVSQGLQPRDPLASISPEQHVLGERNSQFISTTRDYEVAVRGYGRSRSPIAEVDLSKVNARIIDLTNPETLSTFASPEAIYNATRDAEVLIEGPIPPESIGRIHYPD